MDVIYKFFLFFCVCYFPWDFGSTFIFMLTDKTLPLFSFSDSFSLYFLFDCYGMVIYGAFWIDPRDFHYFIWFEKNSVVFQPLIFISFLLGRFKMIRQNVSTDKHVYPLNKVFFARLLLILFVFSLLLSWPLSLHRINYIYLRLFVLTHWFSSYTFI